MIPVNADPLRFADPSRVRAPAGATGRFGMVTRRTVLGLGLAGAAFAAAGGVSLGYSSAIAEARRRVAEFPAYSIPTRFGTMQFADIGSGPPLLMIHGTGGGHDQGIRFARRLITAGHRVIAPSRFGYLGSAFPDDPSPDNQADAFVDLLDHLGLGRVDVAGGSAGALSALALAIRHPERVSALVALVPATHTPERPPARPWSATQQRIAEGVLGSDFLFWLATRLAPGTMTRTLLATDPALVAAASAEERTRVAEILRDILPVSERADGLLADARHAGNPAPMALETIVAPTLAISMEDDMFLTADAARHIARMVPGARLVLFPDGGHVWVGRDAEVFATIDSFLRQTGVS